MSAKSCGKGNGELMFNDYRLSVLPDEKSSGNGTAVMVVHYKYTLNCTFKNG